MSMRLTLSNVWNRFQWELFPALAEEVCRLLENHTHFVRVLDLVEVEWFVAAWQAFTGRPLKDRCAGARSSPRRSETSRQPATWSTG